MQLMPNMSAMMPNMGAMMGAMMPNMGAMGSMGSMMPNMNVGAMESMMQNIADYLHDGSIGLARNIGTHSIHRSDALQREAMASGVGTLHAL